MRTGFHMIRAFAAREDQEHRRPRGRELPPERRRQHNPQSTSRRASTQIVSASSAEHESSGDARWNLFSRFSRIEHVQPLLNAVACDTRGAESTRFVACAEARPQLGGNRRQNGGLMNRERYLSLPVRTSSAKSFAKSCVLVLALCALLRSSVANAQAVTGGGLTAPEVGSTLGPNLLVNGDFSQGTTVGRFPPTASASIRLRPHPTALPAC